MKTLLMTVFIMVFLCCFYAAINRALDDSKAEYDYLIINHKLELSDESN